MAIRSSILKYEREIEPKRAENSTDLKIVTRLGTSLDSP